MTELLHHYQCQAGERRVHSCGGFIIIKEDKAGRTKAYCLGCEKFLNIWQAFAESQIKKIEEASTCSS